MGEPHVAGTQARIKMDASVGLFGGTCSCGWKSSGLESQARALESAQEHANAKNKMQGARPAGLILDETQDFPSTEKKEVK